MSGKKNLFASALVASLLPALALAGQNEIDAKMALFEAAVSPEAVALARNNLVPGGLMQRTLGDSWFIPIASPGGGAATGNPAGRTVVDCAAIPRDGLAVILYAGQSNSANAAGLDGDGRPWQRQNAVYNYNIGDGKCYLAQAPELGADGPDFNDGRGIIGQAFGLPLADLLINAGLYKSVMVVPVGVSGTLIEQWIPGGHHFSRMASAVQGLQAAGLAPTYFLWHQGEGNAGWLGGQDASAVPVSRAIRDAIRLSYMRDFFGLVDGLRALGMQAPVFPAVVAGGCGAPFVSFELQQAHRDLADPAWGIHLGPDTDAIDFSLRRADENAPCHFSHDGNFVHAQRWFEVIRAYMQANGRIPAGQPVATISAAPADYAAGGATISWFSQNVQSCNMRYTYADGSPGGEFPLPANISGSAPGGSGKRMDYLILCNAPGRLIWSAVTLTVWPGPNTVTPRSALTSVTLDKSVYAPGEQISAAFATDPASAGPLDYLGVAPEGGAWASPLSRVSTNGAASGTLALTAPLQPGTYYVPYHIDNGSLVRARSASFTVPGTPTTVSLGINGQQTYITPNGGFVVTLSSASATSCTLATTVGNAAPTSQPVAPNISISSGGALSGNPISYTFTCNGAGGQVSRTATVAPLLTADVTVNGQHAVNVGPNGGFTVSWNSANASACVLTWTIGNAAPVSQPIAPNTSGSSGGGLPGSSPIAYSFVCNGAAGQRIGRAATVSP
jgi:hypothetical protein